MITIDKKVLANSLQVHKDNLLPDIITKRNILAIAIKHINKSNNSRNISNLKSELKSIGTGKILIKSGLNLFLKSDSGKTKHKISTYNDISNFFQSRNQSFKVTTQIKYDVNRILTYLTNERIENILIAEPNNLVNELNDYNSFVSKITSLNVGKISEVIIDFLFSYDSFSRITKTKYDAYDLCINLGVEACLYCNRNFIQTIKHADEPIIRPELDHFIPQGSTSLLRLSFYNLIPSCHICNSNLKGKENFDLNDYFHPYYGCFDDHNTFFKYKPISPKAFFNPNYKNLQIIIDTSNAGTLKKKIDKNIKVFKLNEIYNFNISFVKELQKLKRLSNKKYLEWLRTKVFVDSSGNPKVSKIEEVYESVFMNYYNPADYSKRPMAKFIKDISVELKIINR